MKKRWGLIIAGCGVLLAAGAVLLGLLRKPSPAPPTAEPSAASSEGLLKGPLKVQGATVTKQDEQGRTIWSLNAKTQVQVDAQGKVAQAQGAHWTFREAGGREWVVEAPQVTLQYETGQLEFTDGVDLHTADGALRFRVGRLRYEPDTRQLVGDGPVDYVQGGLHVTGARLVVDTQRKQIRIAGGMKARVRP